MKIRLLILIVLSSIAIDWPADSHAQSPAASQFRYNLAPGESIRLSLGGMTSMPNGVVFIGGSYETLSDPIHTCMLISRDGGKTWTDAQLKFARSTIGPMVSHGSRMVWALVLSSVEGTQEPEQLLISHLVVVSATTRLTRQSWTTVRMPYPRFVLDAQHLCKVFMTGQTAV